MSEETISIKVWLAGRSYPIRIKPEEESAVRKAVKLADEKIHEMKAQYAGKDDQDFMAMCLLSYAADSAIESYNNPVLQEELDKLSRRIDKVIVPGI
ncbi:MAG: cell division protein ZapA [Flavipsychrobacter sp.]|jgi:cell division protein ZapA|nr:cell division protein ZapA [Flavipsychrobacter sp.]